ncbi:RHS repeat-associated core domain-containing protein [Dyella sp. 2RAB6]|uniref:RHS repeat-associated core domain-containing protein n=1 Tax=Dyella sp. 2RAB6 TaxID=3232992 RepID=UPI003F8E28F4
MVSQGMAALRRLSIFLLLLLMAASAFAGEPPYIQLAGLPSHPADQTRYGTIGAAIQGGIAYMRQDPDFAANCGYFVIPANHDPIDVADIGFTGSLPDGTPCNVRFGNGGQYAYTSFSIWQLGDYGFDPSPNLGASCPCDGGLGGEGDGPNMVGDPVNIAIGNKFEQENDFTGSAWLNFSRFYNSSPAGASSITLGLGWRHSFDRRIDLVSYQDGSQIAAIVRPDGKVENFSYSSSGWATSANNPDVLTNVVDAQGAVIGHALSVANAHLIERYDGGGLLQSITDNTGRSLILSYSTSQTPTSIAPRAGLLISVTDPGGRQLGFAYDSDGHLHQVTLPDGGTLIYGFDSSNRLISVQYPDTKVRQYVYNEASLMPSGVSIPNAMTGVVDELGVRYQNTMYQADGRVILTNMALHADEVRLKYTDSWNQTAVTYPLGFVGTLGYGTVAGGYRPFTSTTQYCGPLCNRLSASVTYDANGYPASRSDFNNVSSTTAYDANGLLTKLVEASGTPDQRTTNTSWDTGLRLPLTRTVLDASGNKVALASWVYNTAGQTVAQCDVDPALAPNYVCSSSGTPPAGVRRSTYTYCTAVDGTQCPQLGLLLSVDGPRTDVSDVTHYSYYLSTDESGCGTVGGACHRAGDLAQVTDPLGHTTAFLVYDKNGRILRQKDSNGVFTDYTYTPRGWLKTKSVAGASAVMDYDAVGNLIKSTDPDGVFVTYTYDVAHRLTDVTDSLGDRMHYTLDKAGNRTKEETFDPSGSLRRSLGRTYDTMGQLLSITDGQGHVIFDATFDDSYDVNGSLSHNADGLSVEYKKTYDNLHRLITTLDNTNGADTSMRNAQKVFSYDAQDQLLNIKDPSLLNTSYNYDGLGNRTAVGSPDTGASLFQYDAAGNRTQTTDAKGVVSHSTYDALNRVIGVTYPNSASNVSYRYDEADTVTGCVGSYPIGRLTSIVETAVSTVYCYDARGNAVQKRQTQGTNVDTISYTYTLADRLASTRTPDGTFIQYGRDGLGRITAVSVQSPGSSGASNVVTNVSYLPFGPIASYTLGNGQTIARTYDANYAVTDIVSPALNLHFARDAMGNITALGNAPGASPAAETYSYDLLYHLTTVKNAQGQAIEAYTYNRTGDRLSKAASGLATGTYGYQSGTHLLTSIGNSARTYDANGNTTGNAVGGNTYGYGYNDRNRMTVVQRNGQTVANYTYNALEQRVGKTATFPSSVARRFIYDENNQIVGEYGAASRSYVWLDNLPVALVDTSGGVSSMGYVHADGLSTPRAVADAGGAVVWQWPFQGNPFGEQQPASSSGYAFNLRFPGQYYDLESGLSYNVNRDYDAASGRYVQSDPLGLDGGISTYAYVMSTPLVATDPLGLSRAGWKDSPMDPNGVGCANLLKRIENLKAEIQRQIQNLATNPQTLPYYAPGFDGPGGPLKASVWGHEQLLIKYEADLVKALAEYRNRCGGPPPMVVCPPVESPAPKPAPVPDPVPVPPMPRCSNPIECATH